MFIGFNLLDEVKVLMMGGGVDEHIHHCACAISASVNMAILRATKQQVLKTAMIDAFHTLLANECVAPSFNLYGILKQFNRNHGVAALFTLASLMPLLLFRTINSLTLIKRLLSKEKKDLNVTYGGVIFKYATLCLCLALLSLDFTWTKWTLGHMKRILRRK